MSSHTTTPNFFQQHRSYTLAGSNHSASPALTVIFTVEYVTRNPDTGQQHAVGWMSGTLPGAPRRIATVNEDDMDTWEPYTNPGTLTGHPNVDGHQPVVAVCVFGWTDCTTQCDRRTLTIYATARDVAAARRAAEDAATVHSSTRRCHCRRPEPVLSEVLTVPVGCPEPRSHGANGEDSIIVQVNALADRTRQAT
ncbi:hypothetical protein [Streptomyces sp. NPDC051572]|uniref:hypothetical protein n=1 Tax=Streptomyces sp. NPDC051572 TaxID=3155802 RepID=UPI0034502DD3